MGAVFNLTRLVDAWVAHDRWCLSLSPPEGSKDRSKRLPFNAGGDVTARRDAAVKDAAEALSVDPNTLMACIQAERRVDPGADVAGAIERVIDGLAYETTSCPVCGVEMPNYAVYRDFHDERCGSRVAETVDPRVVETVELLIEQREGEL